MQKRRRTGRISAVLAAVAVLGTLTGTAQAQTSETTGAREAARHVRAEQKCPSGYVCFWSRPYFRGIMRVYKNPRFHICGWVPGYQARSVINRDNQSWSFYGDVNCTAHVVTLSPGSAAANVLVRTWK